MIGRGVAGSRLQVSSVSSSMSSLIGVAVVAGIAAAVASVPVPAHAFGVAPPVAAAIAAAAAASRDAAAAAAAEKARLAADPLVVQVLTFGPGSHPFTKFGHNAIRIIDQQMRTDVVYNFGTFTFDSPRLIIDFLKGRLHYWLSRSSMGGTVRGYRRENRDIEAQELNLSPSEKRELRDRLIVNARPENRDYRYDYFADNCSTRVRDALDFVLRGRLRANAGGRGSMSLRAHALRMAADNAPLYVALLIVLGPSTDRSIDQWAEAFLPEMLQGSLRRAQTSGEASQAGPLVKAERLVFKAKNRAPTARQPPQPLPDFMIVGVVLGGILWLLGRAGTRFLGGRVLFGLMLCLVGLVFGIIGCFLAGAWAFTPHAVVYRNQNVLLFAPIAIALVVLGFGVAFGRRGATRKTVWIGAAALIMTIVACALKALPGPGQDNAALIAMMLPVWLGVTAGAGALAAALIPREPSLPAS